MDGSELAPGRNSLLLQVSEDQRSLTDHASLSKQKCHGLSTVDSGYSLCHKLDLLLYLFIYLRTFYFTLKSELWDTTLVGLVLVLER